MSRMNSKGRVCPRLTALLAGMVLWALCFANIANAQGRYRYPGAIETLDAGTTIAVRTNEDINTNKADGRVYTGVVDQDVMDRNGNIAIPRGSPVEFMVRNVSKNEVVLDLDSVTINGQRYGIQTEGNVVNSQQNEGLGANKRTGEYVGGGAVLGAIIGAIAGGGKGAAIGAGAGAAAGAGVQVLTQGKTVRVPAESLLTFQLAQPLRSGIIDNGYMRNGVHYHRFGTTQQSYNYDNRRQKPGYYSTASGSINIGTDNNITWQGPEGASVYVQLDNQAPRLFASGAYGTQAAPWMNNGHLYVFILRDANGNEIARDQLDLRGYSNR